MFLHLLVYKIPSFNHIFFPREPVPGGTDGGLSVFAGGLGAEPPTLYIHTYTRARGGGLPTFFSKMYDHGSLISQGLVWSVLVVKGKVL